MSQKEIRAICLQFLSRREYSQLELITRLSVKGFSEADSQAVINGLADQGLQSETRFAENYARSRFNRGFGRSKVSYELKQRGIEGFNLQAVIDDNFGDEIALINQVYAKKYSTDLPVNYKERLKRQRFLQQRGFSFELIQSLFSR
ncbi:MAG: regulatory protein RecX [Methylococcales bacterium]|nr:regulatory protein RecX [Methylococcales bacterium]